MKKDAYKRKAQKMKEEDMTSSPAITIAIGMGKYKPGKEAKQSDADELKKYLEMGLSEKEAKKMVAEDKKEKDEVVKKKKGKEIKKK